MKSVIPILFLITVSFCQQANAQLKLKIPKVAAKLDSKKEAVENTQERKSLSAMSNDRNIIYTNKEYKDYAEASSNSITEVKDGDELWMYVKLDKPLSNYIDIHKYTDGDGNLIELHSFHIVIGPKGETYPEFAEQKIYVNSGKNIDKDESLKNAHFTRLDVDPSTTTEFKLLLSKYVRRKSTSIFLKAVGGGGAGKWDNEIRLVHKNKSLTFANGPIMCNVEDGIAKYRKLWKEYQTVIDKGDMADNTLPPTGKFTDAKLKVKILEKLKAHKGLPHSLNFTFDDWEVVGEDNGKSRRMYAYALYKQNGKCSYTMVEVTQIMTVFQSTWSEPEIHFYKEDSPIECK